MNTNSPQAHPPLINFKYDFMGAYFMLIFPDPLDAPLPPNILEFDYMALVFFEKIVEIQKFHFSPIRPPGYPNGGPKSKNRKYFSIESDFIKIAQLSKTIHLLVTCKCGSRPKNIFVWLGKCFSKWYHMTQKHQ